MGNDVGREAGRKDLMPRVGEKLRLIDSLDQAGDGGAKGRGEERPKRKNLKALWSKGQTYRMTKRKLLVT